MAETTDIFAKRYAVQRFLQAIKAKLIMLPCVGTNGRQIFLIAGGPLWKRGYECIALDMPGYGMTEVNPNSPVTNTDWVQIVSDFVDKEAGNWVSMGFISGYYEL